MEKNIKGMKSISGASLIEIMISMFLIALLLIAIVAIFPKMANHRKAISEVDVARGIATETLEWLQQATAPDNRGCSNVLAGNAFSPLPAAAPTQYRSRSVGAVAYTITWPGDQCGTAVDNFHKITVTVGWSKQGKQHNVTVTGAIK